MICLGDTYLYYLPQNTIIYSCNCLACFYHLLSGLLFVWQFLGRAHLSLVYALIWLNDISSLLWPPCRNNLALMASTLWITVLGAYILISSKFVYCYVQAYLLGIVSLQDCSHVPPLTEGIAIQPLLESSTWNSKQEPPHIGTASVNLLTYITFFNASWFLANWCVHVESLFWITDDSVV